MKIIRWNFSGIPGVEQMEYEIIRHLLQLQAVHRRLELANSGSPLLFLLLSLTLSFGRCPQTGSFSLQYILSVNIRNAGTYIRSLDEKIIQFLFDIHMRSYRSHVFE